jgi:hypothetical protein
VITALQEVQQARQVTLLRAPHKETLFVHAA